MSDEEVELHLLFKDDDEADEDEAARTAAVAGVQPAYVTHIANKQLMRYKGKIHYGGKAGESLWTHVMNLVFTIGKLLPLFFASDSNASSEEKQMRRQELCCLLLALTVHDINKLEPYGKRPDGRDARFANASTVEHLKAELEALDVGNFFPEWEQFLPDIKYLVDSQQETSQQDSQFNRHKLEQCQLDQRRLQGPLRYLVKFSDASDNSHSGDYADKHEKHLRDKLSMHLNAALNAMNAPVRYRFIGHRLAELRGLETNIIHNEIRLLFRQIYGPHACIDLFSRPEGTDYLLARNVALNWTPELRHQLAGQIARKFAQMQEDRLSEFVKATPSGISVDDAAIESGASVATIFHLITGIVEKKLYRLEWCEQRSALVRADLEKGLRNPATAPALQEQILLALRETDLVPTGVEILKRGEFLMAYRNFIKEHRAEELRLLKQDAWARVSRLFEAPDERDALYALVDPYRRGYFMARDLPECSIDEMLKLALDDLAKLEREAQSVRASKTRKGVRAGNAEEQTGQEEQSVGEAESQELNVAYIEDYLARNLEVWDSLGAPAPQPAQFADVLRRYVDPRRPHVQCCYCGSALQGEEWMAIQVPPSIGVQSFSNRLEAGGLRDPKRNVCSVCRTQFILEKLAWRSHRDKQGSEQVTFYLHLFPYSYFPDLLLQAWWKSLQELRKQEHTALLINSNSFFNDWQDDWWREYQHFQVKVYPSKLEGLGISSYAETLSNTPVMPFIVSGKNYSEQFILALEKTVIMALWFDCRVLLSRLPTPLLNLGNERIGDEPVALLVEGIPQPLGWLAPANAFTRKDVETLCRKLGGLHRIARKLAVGGDDPVSTIYKLVTAATNDPLALYFQADRLIERHVAQRKAANPDSLAITLTHDIAKEIEYLLKE